MDPFDSHKSEKLKTGVFREEDTTHRVKIDNVSFCSAIQARTPHFPEWQDSLSLGSPERATHDPSSTSSSSPMVWECPLIGVTPTRTSSQQHTSTPFGATAWGYTEPVASSAPPGERTTRSQTPPLRRIPRQEQALSTSPQGSRSPGAVDSLRGDMGSQPRRRSSPWERCCVRRRKNM